MFSIPFKSNIIIFGTDSLAKETYFRLRQNFNIIGFLDNNATAESTLCDMPVYTLAKMNQLQDAIAVVYGPKTVSICNWLNEHNFKLFKHYIPSFMFEYDRIDFVQVSMVTPEDQMKMVLNRLKQGKSIALIHGNCQIIPLKLYLTNNKRFNEKYILYDIPALHLINESNNMIFRSNHLFEDVDLFITQQVSDNNRFGYYLSTQNFLDHLSEKCKIVTIINLWFDAYFPQHSAKVESPITPYLTANLWADSNLEKMGSEKTSIDEILSTLQDENFYSKEYLNTRFENSIKTLIDREQFVDVHMSDYVQQLCRDDILFYSVNHPKNFLVKELARRCLRYIDLYQSHELIEFLHEELLDDTSTLKITCEAIYPSVFKFLNTDKNAKNYSLNYPGAIKNRPYVTFEEYIKDYLTFNHNYPYME